MNVMPIVIWIKSDWNDQGSKPFSTLYFLQLLTYSLVLVVPCN